jgi:multidrug efflux pump subunit AcrA (membrane-fusion protein)
VKRALLAALVVALLGAGARAGWRAWRSGDAPAPVPTAVVAREQFVRRVNAEGNLRAVKATPLSVPQSGQGGPKKLAWLAEDGSQVKAGDVVVRFDPSEPEKALRDGEADLAAARAKLAKEQATSRAAVAGRDAAAALAEQELERTRQFQQKDQTIFSKNQIIESEIDQTLAGARQSHASEVKQVERTLSRSKADVITVEQRQAELVIHHARDALSSMEVKAPHDGVFVLRRGWRGSVPRIGDQMWPSQTVAEIPLLDAMEAEVFVLEVDASGLAEGQSVEVVIEARPEQPFAGKVRLVEKLAKPRVPGSPVQYFAVVVALDRTERELMKPGQRVRAVITLADEEALVVPRQAVVTRDSKNVVYRQGKAGFEPVEVELGAATAGRVVITAGLEPGDRIALRDPTRSVDQALGGSGSGSAAASGSGEAAP